MFNHLIFVSLHRFLAHSLDTRALSFYVYLCGRKFDTILMPLIGSPVKFRFVSVLSLACQLNCPLKAQCWQGL